MRCLAVLATVMLTVSYVGFGETKSLDRIWNTVFKHFQAKKTSYSPPERRLLKEYDFVIVGAGTAGCTLANRLTENPKWKVLLIEAGKDPSILTDIPLMAAYFQLTEDDWSYKTEPQTGACLAMIEGRCNWPRGKVIGGSSVLNYMVYTRGNKRDYDDWEEMGNHGWSYQDILPYFRRAEDMQIHSLKHSKYHNLGGPVSVSYPQYHTPLASAFVLSGLESGHRINDYNGKTQSGFSYLQASLKNGERWSAARAHLNPAKHRLNLHVTRDAMVTKILIEPKTKRAYGVTFVKRGRTVTVLAKKEVILSAGTINTPQLLILSGIGPSEHLRELGIPVLQNLRVGDNLQDHVAMGGLSFLVNESVSLVSDRLLTDIKSAMSYYFHKSGPITIPGGVEAIAFLNTNRNPQYGPLVDYPDVELFFLGGTLASQETLQKAFGIRDDVYDAVYRPLRGTDGWMVFPMLLRPKSVGRIRLRSTNPFDSPLINPNYFADSEDVEIIVEGVLKTIELSKTRAFQKFGSRLNTRPIPACSVFPFGSRDYWRCATRQITLTIYHHTGTAKMGPYWDRNAVVNHRLQVYGIDRLRVIDASIMPKVPSGHTNAPTYMIAEKGADMIKQDWS